MIGGILRMGDWSVPLKYLDRKAFLTRVREIAESFGSTAFHLLRTWQRGELEGTVLEVELTMTLYANLTVPHEEELRKAIDQCETVSWLQRFINPPDKFVNTDGTGS